MTEQPDFILKAENEVLRRSVQIEHEAAAMAHQKMVKMREVLRKMVHWFGNPHKDEWLSQDAFKQAYAVSEEAKALLKENGSPS